MGGRRGSERGGEGKAVICSGGEEFVGGRGKEGNGLSCLGGIRRGGMGSLLETDLEEVMVQTVGEEMGRNRQERARRKDISLVSSASQTKPCVEQGKVCCYCALDSKKATLSVQ